MRSRFGAASGKVTPSLPIGASLSPGVYTLIAGALDPAAGPIDAAFHAFGVE